ncbi:MAG: DUF424 family protein [Candidatus Nitrosocaldaceae archaeon]
MSKAFAVRKNFYKGSLMVNICDIELLGTTLREGELTINITKEYFCESIINEEEIISLLKECSIANLVGNNSVKNAVSLKLASEASIRWIDNVPFLMFFKFTLR